MLRAVLRLVASLRINIYKDKDMLLYYEDEITTLIVSPLTIPVGFTGR